MKFKFLHILAFLCVAIVASHASLPSEEYWNFVLPNTPMPKAVKDLLQSGSIVCKGGVIVGTHPKTPLNKGDSTPFRYNNYAATKIQSNEDDSTPFRYSKYTATKTQSNEDDSTPFLYKNYAATKTQLNKGDSAPAPPFLYKYAATKTQLNNPNVALFLLEKDLHIGKRINLQFSKTTNQATFLSQPVADSIPFSSNKLPEIFDKFSVNPSSDEARVMKKTIKECEEKAVKGEERLCATSLESMVDFTTSKMGKDVRAISTIAENGGRKEYSIVGVKKTGGQKSAVVCHRQEYAYAVFYCHKTDTTDAYEVEMIGSDGSEVEAVAVCHKDTSEWNPRHLAFQVLSVEPGTPICHFLPEDHIVWVSNI